MDKGSTCSAAALPHRAKFTTLLLLIEILWKNQKATQIHGAPLGIYRTNNYSQYMRNMVSFIILQ